MPISESVHNEAMTRQREDGRQLELWPTLDEPQSAVAKPQPAVAKPQVIHQIPDVRDGLTREQRIILYALHMAQKERPNRRVSTTLLYGRVCEFMPMPEDRFQALLANLVGRGVPGI